MVLVVLVVFFICWLCPTLDSFFVHQGRIGASFLYQPQHATIRSRAKSSYHRVDIFRRKMNIPSIAQGWMTSSSHILVNHGMVSSSAMSLLVPAWRKFYPHQLSYLQHLKSTNANSEFGDDKEEPLAEVDHFAASAEDLQTDQMEEMDELIIDNVDPASLKRIQKAVLDSLSDPSEEDMAAVAAEFGLDNTTEWNYPPIAGVEKQRAVEKAIAELRQKFQEEEEDEYDDDSDDNEGDSHPLDAKDGEMLEDEENAEYGDDGDENALLQGKTILEAIEDASEDNDEFGRSLAEAAFNASIEGVSSADRALWEEMMEHRKQVIQERSQSNHLPGNNISTLLFRDGKFIRPLKGWTNLTDEQMAYVQQFKIINETEMELRKNMKPRGRAKHITGRKVPLIDKSLYQYPDMLVPTTINSTIYPPHRRKGIRMMDIIELKEMIQRAAEHRIIEVIQEKIENGTYLPMDTTYSPRFGVEYLVKDQEEEDKAELAVAMELLTDPSEVKDFLNNENLMKRRQSAREIARNVSNAATNDVLSSFNISSVIDTEKDKIPKQVDDDLEAEIMEENAERKYEGLTEEERVMLEEDEKIRKKVAYERFMENYNDLKEFRAYKQEYFANMTEPTKRRRRKTDDDELEEGRESVIPTREFIRDNAWIVSALGEEYAFIKDSGRTMLERIKFLDEGEKNRTKNHLENIETLSIIIKAENETVPHIDMLREGIIISPSTDRIKESALRMMEPMPPRSRIYISKESLDEWREKVTSEYKDIRKIEVQRQKLKTNKGQFKRIEEISKGLAEKYNLEISMKIDDVSMDDLRVALDRLIRNETLTNEWIKRFEDLTERVEVNGSECLTDDDEITQYVFLRALRCVEKDVRLLLQRDYLDRNETVVDVIPGEYKHVPYEYLSRRDERDPNKVAEKMMLHTAETGGKSVEQVTGDPLFDIPFDPYYQQPFAEVYAAVCNTSSNSSMVDIAERLFTHIYEATNGSKRISYNMLIFGEETEGIVPKDQSDSIQVWVEGHTIFHLVDGVAMKEAWGCIPEHVIFSPRNLDLIVQQVTKCAVETELGGFILSPFETSRRIGKQDPSAVMPMTTALNYHEQLPDKFSTVNTEP